MIGRVLLASLLKLKPVPPFFDTVCACLAFVPLQEACIGQDYLVAAPQKLRLRSESCCLIDWVLGGHRCRGACAAFWRQSRGATAASNVCSSNPMTAMWQRPRREGTLALIILSRFSGL